MFGKYNGFVSKARVSACMYFLVLIGGFIFGGLIFGWAYIWNDVSVSTCGGLIHGGLIFGGEGLIVGGLRYIYKYFQTVFQIQAQSYFS